jgi:hypothetical protein
MLHALHAICKKQPLPNFRMIIGGDGNIYLDKIEKKIKKGCSVFLGIPLRLGIDKIT